jgi:hypothetical protein
MQLPPKHASPAAQSPSPVQLVGHALVAPLHTKGEQLGLPVAPAARSVHVPRLPARLQALHGPSQSLLQQYPSAQLPLSHSNSDEQVTPVLSSVTQLPALSQ